MPILSIDHFKSFSQLELDLAAVNVFIGANGSGKTNLLEAFGILGAAAHGDVDDASLARRGVRPGLPRLYKSNFDSVRQFPHIGFGIRNPLAKYSVTLNESVGKWLFKTESLSAPDALMTRGPKTEANKEYGFAPRYLAEHKADNPCVVLLENLRDFRIFSPYTPMLRGLVPDPQTLSPLGLSGGRLADAVFELKGQLSKNKECSEAWDELLELVEWLTDVDTVQQASNLLSPNVPRQGRMLCFTDRHMRRGRNTLTGHDASEGVLYLLFMGVLAIHDQAPAWLAVDNLDQALNPLLVQRLLRWLCKIVLDDERERCLLFTVHNPACLDSLPLKDDRVRLFSMDRTNKGYSVIHRIQPKEGLDLNDWPLSRLWMMGHLGGVPNV